MIRLAAAADLDAVCAIYREILAREKTGMRYTQWIEGLYPTRETAERGLREGALYVLEEGGAVAASVILNGRQPAEYREIPWLYPAGEGEVLVIHTLCIHPDAAGGGWGRRFVAFAEGLAAGRGCRAMRLDTYEGNAPAAAFYPKLGYRLAGETEFFFEGFRRETLICFEKALTKEK